MKKTNQQLLQKRQKLVAKILKVNSALRCGDNPPTKTKSKKTRSYNVGKSNYSEKKIQPWDIWIEYNLNPFDADIVKRILRTKEGESRILDYAKIIHICKERIRQEKKKSK